MTDTTLTNASTKPRFFRWFPSDTKALSLALCSIPFTWGAIIWFATR